MTEETSEGASEDISKFIQRSPDLRLENPPAALFATTDSTGVDLYGTLSVVALKNPKEFIVFDPVEDRRSRGVFDSDENIDGQIEDIQFLKSTMETEDPARLKERIVEIFKFIERRKLFLHGILELEANAFGSSIFMDVDASIVNKLEAMYKLFKDETAFPQAETSGLIRKGITIRFVGVYGVLGRLWPRQKGITGRDFIVNLNGIRGHVAGIVAVNLSDSVAEFIILKETVEDKSGQINWIVMKQVLEDFRTKAKVPICWFSWSFGLNALSAMAGYDAVSNDPEIQLLVEDYNVRISDTVMDYYKSADIVGTEPQVDLMTLNEEQKELARHHLLEALAILDQMLKETGG
jgi:hypothetical protein